jgi:hypothetical protein
MSFYLKDRYYVNEYSRPSAISIAIHRLAYDTEMSVREFVRHLVVSLHSYPRPSFSDPESSGRQSRMAVRGGHSVVSDDSSTLKSGDSDIEHDGDGEDDDDSDDADDDDDDDDDDEEGRADLDDLDLSSSAIHDLEMTALDPEGVPFGPASSNGTQRPPSAERESHPFHLPAKAAAARTSPSRSPSVYSSQNGVVWTREEGDHDFITVESS